MEECVNKMAYAFYVLLDRMMENMPEAIDRYMMEVAIDVDNSKETFKAAEKELRSLIKEVKEAL